MLHEGYVASLLKLTGPYTVVMCTLHAAYTSGEQEWSSGQTNGSWVPATVVINLQKGANSMS